MTDPADTPAPASRQPTAQELALLLELLGLEELPPQVTHIRTLPAQQAQTGPWPTWLAPELRKIFEGRGVHEPYLHQLEAADLAHQSAGDRHLILATGTASGKSLAYQLPTLQAIYEGEHAPVAAGFDDGRATVLYLAPTKALAADQLTFLRSLGLEGLVAETYDGDTPQQERSFIRQRANYLLCNPDSLHYAILPYHGAWSRFFRRLRYVIIDEAHAYRGVFGAHLALMMRRLRRICAYYGARPVFIGASATSAQPAVSFGQLIGSDPRLVTAISRSTAPRGARQVLLWEPEFLPQQQVTDRLAVSSSRAASSPQLRGGSSSASAAAPLRKSALQQGAEFLADLVAQRTRTLAFVHSRRGAEALASLAASYLEELDSQLAGRVAAYRAGYLPEERRQLEEDLRRGQLLGLASTSALEVGIDISGLDAVILAGWPGTRASFFQQIGRAGRAGQESLAILVARQDPLDTYLVHHPQAIFETELEKNVFDPTNPYVLGPHLCAAAAELPLTAQDFPIFGPQTRALLGRLEEQGYLRQRPGGWFWTQEQSAHQLAQIRGQAGRPLQIIEEASGALIGSMDASQAQLQGHPGAIYTHQGKSYLVLELDEAQGLILVEHLVPDYYTQAQELSQVTIMQAEQSQPLEQEVTLNYGTVRVRSQVVGYQAKSLVSQQILAEEPLDLEPRFLQTKAIWWTIPSPQLHAAGIREADIPGALHAAEHAAIGLLPLIATCDRWDIGGLSTALHMDTGQPTIFIYDGHQGGAGFTQRGYEQVNTWLRSTLDTILACDCQQGCPSCVQSPKCGNRNEPLDKAGAARLLALLLVSAGALEQAEARQLLAQLAEAQQKEAESQGQAGALSVVEALTGQGLAQGQDPF